MFLRMSENKTQHWVLYRMMMSQVSRKSAAEPFCHYKGSYRPDAHRCGYIGRRPSRHVDLSQGSDLIASKVEVETSNAINPTSFNTGPGEDNEASNIDNDQPVSSAGLEPRSRPKAFSLAPIPCVALASTHPMGSASVIAIS